MLSLILEKNLTILIKFSSLITIVIFFYFSPVILLNNNSGTPTKFHNELPPIQNIPLNNNVEAQSGVDQLLSNAVIRRLQNSVFSERTPGELHACVSDTPDGDPTCMCSLNQCRLSTILNTRYENSWGRRIVNNFALWFETSSETEGTLQLEGKDRGRIYERELIGRVQYYIFTCVPSIEQKDLRSTISGSTGLNNISNPAILNFSGELQIKNTEEEVMLPRNNNSPKARPVKRNFLKNNLGTLNLSETDLVSRLKIGTRDTYIQNSPFRTIDIDRFFQPVFQETIVFHDMASAISNNWYLPIGSACVRDNKTQVAYWQNPNYFYESLGDEFFTLNDQQNSVFGGCQSPLLTQRDLFNREVTGTLTQLGCLPNSINGLVAFVVRLITGVIGLILLVIITANTYKIISDPLNAEAKASAQKNMVQAVIIFFIMLLSLTILNVVGLTILDFGNVNGILGIFTGG